MQRTLIPLLALLAAAPGAGARPGTHAVPGVRGHYVEARTASVFAGACHYGGEATTQGREAVLAWTLDAGSHAGVDLGGSAAVAVVTADCNLAEAAGDGARSARRSLLYVPVELDPRRREALVGWLLSRHGDALGTIAGVEPAQLDVRVDGEAFDVRVGDFLELRGEGLADRACCRMPFQVWYEPFVPLDDLRVGNCAVFRCAAEGVGPRWLRRGENNAFLGTLAVAQASAGGTDA